MTHTNSNYSSKQTCYKVNFQSDFYMIFLFTKCTADYPLLTSKKSTLSTFFICPLIQHDQYKQFNLKFHPTQLGLYRSRAFFTTTTFKISCKMFEFIFKVGAGADTAK